MASYSDAFTRANAPLASATWYSTNVDNPAIVSNAVYNAGSGVGTYRSALASGRSSCQITLTTKGSTSPYGGPCIAMNVSSPTPTAADVWLAGQAVPFYRFVAKSSGYQLQRKADGANTFTDVGSQYATTPADGAVMKVDYDENTGILNGYVGGTLRCTYTDPAPVTGGRYSGIFVNTGTTVDTWSAADLVTAPVASFTKDLASGEAPLTVTFTDTSTNTPTSWAWDFGDTGTSTSQNPSHAYADAGTYSVILTATNAGGSDPSAAQTVTVSNPAATGRMKYWSGSAWVSKPLKYWNGASWVTKTSGMKVWDGAAFVAVDGAGTDPPTPTAGTILHSAAGFSGFQNALDMAPVEIHGAAYLLTAGDVSGVGRSDDGGAYWWARNSYLESVSSRKALSGIHWSRYTAGVAWVFSHGGVAKSTDYAQTFTNLTTTSAATNPETGGSDHPRQTGRMIHEGANGNVYIGTKDGVYRSTNGGTTFASWALSGTKVTGIVEDPVDNTMLYVTTTAQTSPGVHAVKVSDGTSTRYALGDAQDLVALDVGGVTYLFVAAGLQGVRRWVRSGTGTTAISTGWTDITGTVPRGDVTTLTASETSASTNTSLTVASTAGFANAGSGHLGKDSFSWTSITATSLNGITWTAPTSTAYPAGTAVAEKVNGGSPGRWSSIDAVYYNGNIVMMVGFWDEQSLVDGGSMGSYPPGFETIYRTVTGLSNPPTWAGDTSNYVQLGQVGDTGTSFYAWVNDAYLRLNGSTGDVSQIRIDPSNPVVAYVSGRNVPSKRVDGTTRWRPSGRGHNAWIGHEVSSHPSTVAKVISSAVDWGVIASTASFESGSPIMTNITTNAAYGIKIGSNAKGYVAAGNRDNATGGEEGDILVNDDPWATPNAWTSTSLNTAGIGRACGVAMTEHPTGPTTRLVAFVNPNSGSTDPLAGFYYKNGSGSWTRCANGSGQFAKITGGFTGANVPIEVSPTSPGTLYAVIFWDGLWRSTDYGVTWSRIWAKTTPSRWLRSITMDQVTANRIAVTIGLDMWIITNAHNGTLNANGTTASGTISATKNALGGVQHVASRPDGRIFALTTGPGDSRIHSSTDWSAFTALNVGKVGEVVRLPYDMHATTDRLYIVGDGEGLVVVDPGV